MHLSVERSKLRLRKFIEGDYLYIDIDAIPIADLSEVFEIQTDLAMVNDHNLPPKKFVFLEYEREIFDKMQWSLPAEYYNSGVMFVKDTDLTHDFFKRWHELWLLNCAIGLHKDQPAMHEAIRQKKNKSDKPEFCMEYANWLSQGFSFQKSKNLSL